MTNPNIGKRVNDHICMPLGLYIVNDDHQKNYITPKDAYEALLATIVVRPTPEEESVVNLDFFTGDLGRLSYLASSLYLCYLPFNLLRRIMARFPRLFTVLANAVQNLIGLLSFVYTLLHDILLCIITFRGVGESALKTKLTTSLIKFNCVQEGHYVKGKGDKIVLKFFEDKHDFTIAEEAIKKNIEFLNATGSKPNFLVRFIFQLITKIPYEKEQVKRYVQNFSKRTLLSEQHLAGGCLFGSVIDKGIANAGQTGKVTGSDNIYVADLSAVSLPRVSTQMTAYLIGHHVGKQLYGPRKS